MSQPKQRQMIGVQEKRNSGQWKTTAAGIVKEVKQLTKIFKGQVVTAEDKEADYKTCLQYPLGGTGDGFLWNCMTNTSTGDNMKTSCICLALEY